MAIAFPTPIKSLYQPIYEDLRMKETDVESNDGFLACLYTPRNFLFGEMETLPVVRRVGPGPCEFFADLGEAVHRAEAAVRMSSLNAVVVNPVRHGRRSESAPPGACRRNHGTGPDVQTADMVSI